MSSHHPSIDDGSGSSRSKHHAHQPPSAAAAIELRQPLRQRKEKRSSTVQQQQQQHQHAPELSSLLLQDIVELEEEEQDEAADPNSSSRSSLWEGWPPAVQVVALPIPTTSTTSTSEDSGDETAATTPAAAAQQQQEQRGRRRTATTVVRLVSYRTANCRTLAPLSLSLWQQHPRLPHRGRPPLLGAAAAPHRSGAKTVSSAVAAEGTSGKPTKKPQCSKNGATAPEGAAAAAAAVSGGRRNTASDESNRTPVPEPAHHQQPRTAASTAAAAATATSTTALIRHNFSSVPNRAAAMPNAGGSSSHSNSSSTAPPPPPPPLFAVPPTERIWSCDLCGRSQMTSREFWQHCLGAAHLRALAAQKQQEQEHANSNNNPSSSSSSAPPHHRGAGIDVLQQRQRQLPETPRGGGAGAANMGNEEVAKEEEEETVVDTNSSEIPVVGESEPSFGPSEPKKMMMVESSNAAVVSQDGRAARQLSERQPDEVAGSDPVETIPAVSCDDKGDVELAAVDVGLDSVPLPISTVEARSDVGVEETRDLVTDDSEQAPDATLTGEEAEKENNNDDDGDAPVSDGVAVEAASCNDSAAEVESEHPANDQTADEAEESKQNPLLQSLASVPNEESLCCEKERAHPMSMGEFKKPATNAVVETENMSETPTDDHDSTKYVGDKKEEAGSDDDQDQNQHQNRGQTPEKTVSDQDRAHDGNKSIGKETSQSPETLETKPTQEDGSFLASPISHDSESECDQDETSSRRLMGDLKDEINADLSKMESLEDQLMADMGEAASQMTSLREDDNFGFDHLPSPTKDLESQCIVTGTPPEKIQLDCKTPPPLLSPREDTVVAAAAAPVAIAAPPPKPSGKVPKTMQELQQLCASVTKNKDDEFWTCGICDIHRLPTHNVKSHCLGKKHTTAVAQQLKDANGATNKSPTKQSSAPDPEQEKLDFHKNTVLENAKTDERFAALELKDGGWSCGLCGTHNMQMNDVVPHCRGKKHAAALDTSQQLSKEEFAVLNDGCWSCTLCDVHGLRVNDVQRHFAGKKHRAAVKQHN